MVLVYHGKLEHLAQEVAEVREAIDRRYAEILGPQRAQLVESTARRILGSDSYFDDIHTFNRKFQQHIPEDDPNKMLLLADSEFHIAANGTVLEHKVRTGVGFYISDRGFEHSGSKRFTERAVASYIHEFDHFIWYALQKVPMYSLHLFLGEYAPQEGLPIYLQKLDQQDLPVEEKKHRLSLASFHTLMTEMYEKSNRILDRMVLKYIGIEVPLPWRHQERKFRTVYLQSIHTVVAEPVEGDPFKALSDQEALERVLQWEKYMNLFMGKTEFMHNLIRSLTKVKVSRVSLTDLLEFAHRKKKKK